MDDDIRVAKLNKLLNDILHGANLTKHNSPRFLEAIRVQMDPATCMNKIIGSPTGLDSIQAALRFDLSHGFMNGHATETLAYFQAPELEGISGGSYLAKLIQKIVDPPIFWDAFTSAFTSGHLVERGARSFAWLLWHLVQLPGPAADPYIEQAALVVDAITGSSDVETRSLGYKIKNIMETCKTVVSADSDIQPGGRHDNDFPDFRRISILPTADEVASNEAPFLRRYDRNRAPLEPASAVSQCLDDQFRLLREDMLYEMKEELQIAFKKKPGHHRGLVVEGFKLVDEIYHRPTDEKGPGYRWGIVLEATQPLWFFNKVANRKQYLLDHRHILKHQAYTCLIVDGEVVAFPTIHRDEDRLAGDPPAAPAVILQFEGETSMKKALLRLKKTGRPSIKLIQIDTAIFSYEPVLAALQDMRTMPLARELLCWSPTREVQPPSRSLSASPIRIIAALREDRRQDLSPLLKTPKSIILDESQALSLLAGLTQNVSLIQGPPGTGKSFIGALLAKVLHDAKLKILVVCYTNHALDQFLEDILDIGVPSDSIVRLGGKSTTRTEPLSLYKQTGNFRLNRSDWQTIDSLKSDSVDLLARLKKSWTQYVKRSPDLWTQMEFDDSADFLSALTVPDSGNGMTQVGKGGKKIGRNYLLDEWVAGRGAGVFQAHPDILAAADVWSMNKSSRIAKVDEWKRAFREDQVAQIIKTGSAYNECQKELDRLFNQDKVSVLRSKRIIGCTTTAAAKYTKDIQAASPNVLIVEEAGEILESHVITALGRDTQQMILIGDHKQLRPKVNNYLLTVEKGEGFDLNRSLFERLVLEGYPHEVLSQQHRMRPEISALVRALTYPDLVDAPSTLNRPNLRGVRDNLIFIDHDKPEDEHSSIKNQVEGGSKSSKRNRHEAQMVLKIVKYLAQQGYGADKLVVLTPYLGQLQELRSVLAAENDPVLNDLDSHDLVSAGLLPAASAKISKPQLRLATIDNYQGEESDIVISCLTRSNSSHDIGFMHSPERLNVLLSRPRNAFIMIGNSDTFLNSRKGKELWTKFFGLLSGGGRIYDGLPVHCERHPDRKAILKSPIDFQSKCPDGGCLEPCGTMLKCGLHKCPSKCHQLSDHSKMDCLRVMPFKCPSGHAQSWKCHKGPPATCRKCEHEAELAEKKRQKDFEIQQQRDAAQLAYKQKLAAIDAEIAERTREEQERREEAERTRGIQQKERDLENLKARLARAANKVDQPSQSATTAPVSSPEPPATTSAPTTTAVGSNPASAKNPTPAHHSNTLEIPTSPARDEWERQKNLEGAHDDAIDAIMEMIGLEEVKSKVLDMKASIDTAVRQGVSLKERRFNTTFLGNPGTGKTTVARHYAKFLSSVGILAGSEFVETTGSRMSNDGVDKVKKMLEDTLGNGGGVIFVDEAYQLTSPQNFRGPEVLDFLLAEMENNVGAIVFIFAGYEKEMETFFEHNPGLTSRVPHQLKFKDYSDSQLLGMLDQLIKKRYNGNMKVEAGIGGLYARIAVRRLGRGRGRPGFGNARALQNVFDIITARQATRLSRQRKEGHRPDDFLLAGQDLIGPDPSKASQTSEAWIKLQKLTGLTSVKESVRSILSLIETNYRRELTEQEPMQMSFNHVFFGNPGSGKTTVAKLYGQILADLFLISKSEVVVKNPADFIGSVLGASEENTKTILASTVGKVLVIDEAYMLYGGSGGTASQNDPYKTAVIDTIVAEIQSVPGEDRCVLMLGYEEQMMEMFQNVNPGLSRRFNIESAFRFEDFSNDELREILDFKLKTQHLAATDAAKDVAIEYLSRARIRPNFGNAGEVENLLGLAKKRYQTRASKSKDLNVVFEPQDFDPEFDRGSHAATNLTKLFEDVVGCEDIVRRLGEYQTLANNAKARGKDIRHLIPTNWVFKGPPGTGKTTVARKMGQVYYDMGFLAQPKVEECSASDLVGQFVGQTGPKTTKLFEKALGRVLFIDEAYRLGGGQFAKEAIDELVGILTQPRFQSKIVVILAGYDDEMNALLSVNTGLSSRFPEEIVFRNMSPEQCMQVLRKELTTEDVQLDGNHDSVMLEMIQQMSQLRSWGNARDMKTISKKMIGIALGTAPTGEEGLHLSPDAAIACMQEVLTGLQNRSAAPPASSESNLFQQMFAPPPSAPVTSTRSTTKSSLPDSKVEEIDTEQTSGRDKGVSDAVWRQLQADILAAKAEEKRRQRAIEEAERLVREAEAQERERIAEVQRLEAQAREQAEMEEVKRRLEQLRIAECLAREERERRARELEERRRAAEVERKKEAKAQEALRSMGVCVAGYRWIKQAGGYRCAGGYHFVSNGQLGM
ncbi:P-loop containing nucleoside triphosphate hydrolase protein [Roridomyces roridus]|uniref:P-loop containing nucleoside triphosphate hydrolase protein n=1 Tax=Roridomyces roridus TaxID=1738132 RepID=A0AAD7G216_9AGAR|nr:P-loop containing nucleoside triphosphate hydrolase protein [Roridomyces roridus]